MSELIQNLKFSLMHFSTGNAGGCCKCCENSKICRCKISAIAVIYSPKVKINFILKVILLNANI